MTALRFRIYPAATPTTGLLVTLDGDDVEIGSGVRVELNGSGSGRIVIHSDHPDVTAANFARGNYVLVHDLDLGEDIGGFWLTEGEFRAVSQREEGGRILTFGGPGSLHYLSRAMWWNSPFVASGSGVYNGPRDDGLWHWFQDEIGQIYKRFIDEAQDPDRPGDPIPALTYDFDNSLDSAGDPWEAMTDSDFTFAIGTGGMDTTAEAMRYGLTIWMRPNLLLQAFQEEVGTDRTGGAFGAGVVRFERGVNIAADLSHAIHATNRVERLLVKGESPVPTDMILVTDGGAPVDSEGFFDYGRARGVAALTAAGEADVALRAAETTTAKFPFKPGDDEANGLYTPGWPGGSGHFWLGDPVTLHTGTDAYDFNEVEVRVAAITWDMRAAGDWAIEVELGATYYSISEPKISGITAPGTAQSCGCCPTGPSGPYSFGDEPTLLLPRLYFANDSEPNLALDASWDTDLREPSPTQLMTTSDTDNGVISTPDNWSGLPRNICAYQGKFVLTGAVDFTGGSVRSQARTKAKSGIGIFAQGYQSQLVVRLFNSGGTLKGYLLSAHEPGSLDSQEWSNEGTGGPSPPTVNAMFPADSRWVNAFGAPLENALAGVAGDYLLMEWGGRHITGQEGPGAGFGLHAVGNRGSDLPANDQTTQTDLNGWIEFFGPAGDFLTGDGGPPASTDAAGSIGTPGCEFAYSTHRHGHQTAGNTPITDEDGHYTGDTVEEALAEAGPRLLPPGGDDGQVLTKLSSTDYDADWEDATGGGGGNGVVGFSGVSLTKSAVQSIATATQTAVTFDGEEFDTHGFHDNSTNPARITIPSGSEGYYVFGGSIEIDALADAHFLVLRFRKNGTTTLDGRARGNSSGGAGGLPGPAYSKPVFMAAGDYIELMAEHDHGSNRDIRSSANGTSFWAIRVGISAPTAPPIYVRVSRAAAQTIATATDTAISFDTEDYDPFGFWASGTDVVIPAGMGGIYMVGGSVGWDSSSATGYGQVYVINSTQGKVLRDSRAAASATFSLGLVAGDLWQFNAGDVIRLQVRHTKGSNRDTTTAAMWLVKVASSPGPAVLTNEIQNFPSLEGANDTQPEWWEESAGTATLTEVDVVGESITESWERCLKLVTTADVYAYQRYTYADEKRLKVGKTASCLVAVWAVGGATARVRIQSSVGSLGVATTTVAAWSLLVVEGVVLDGTYVDLRLEVNNGTAYFVPLAFGVGSNAPNELPPRGLVYRHKDSPPAIRTLTGLNDEATWTDIDVTSVTSPLAARAQIGSVLFEPTSDFRLYSRRNGSSDGPADATFKGFGGPGPGIGVQEWTTILDDQQIFEYYLDRTSGSSALDFGEIYLRAWWEWE